MKNKKAQSTIEFTFGMVIIALLIYGLIKVFQWVGMDYARKAYSQQHDVVIDSTGKFADETRRERLNAFTRKF